MLDDIENHEHPNRVYQLDLRIGRYCKALGEVEAHPGIKGIMLVRPSSRQAEKSLQQPLKVLSHNIVTLVNGGDDA